MRKIVHKSSPLTDAEVREIAWGSDREVARKAPKKDAYYEETRTLRESNRKPPKRVTKEAPEHQLNSLQKRAKTPPTKDTVGKKVSAKKTTRRQEPVEPAARATPRKIEGYVTLAQLAEARKIQAQLARLWVVKAVVPKPTDGWRWKVGSRELARVSKIIGLDK